MNICSVSWRIASQISETKDDLLEQEFFLENFQQKILQKLQITAANFSVTEIFFKTQVTWKFAGLLVPSIHFLSR